MDQLASALQTSLSPNPAERRAAERTLDTLKASPGFSQVALELAQSSNAGYDKSIRQAAAVAFKNFIRQGWKKVCRRRSLLSVKYTLTMFLSSLMALLLSL